MNNYRPVPIIRGFTVLRLILASALIPQVVHKHFDINIDIDIAFSA